MILSLEKNFLAIDNYKQIKFISSDLINLEEIDVKGNNLKIKAMNRYRVVISGEIKELIIR